MKILGKINVNNESKELSVTKEGELYKYYLDNEVIGAYSPDHMTDSLIAFKENTIENDLSGEIKDEITQIIEKVGKEEIIKATEEREKEEIIYDKQKGYEKAIGEDNKTEKDQEDLNKDKNKEKRIDTKSKAENIKDAKSNKKVENTTADINIKQEVDMSTMATDFDSLGEKLEKAGKIKGADEKNGKLGIVESDELDNLRDENGKKLEGHSSRYETVVITNKTGKDRKPIVRALDLENDTQEGTNPTENIYQVKQNKNESIEKGDVLTRLKIQGQETIGIEKGQYGEVEVYHSSNKTIGGQGIEGNQSLDKQLETSNAKHPVEGMDEETQKLSQEYQDGYRSIESSYQEAKEHENTQEEPCEELEPEDMDGNPNTSTHNHIDDIVNELMGNNEISEKFTEREIRERVEREWNQKDDNESLEKFTERVEEDIETDAQYMKGERQ